MLHRPKRYLSCHRRSFESAGLTSKIKLIIVDNRWIVKYSYVLSKIFDAHVNVEIYNSVKLSSIFVDIFIKEVMRLFSVFSCIHRVREYESERYISSYIAVWRVFYFPIHERYPSVFNLDIHLENDLRVYFLPDNLEEILNNPPSTTLLSYFDLWQNYKFVRFILYCEISRLYTIKNGNFERIKSGENVENLSGVKKIRVRKSIHRSFLQF